MWVEWVEFSRDTMYIFHRCTEIAYKKHYNYREMVEYEIWYKKHIITAYCKWFWNIVMNPTYQYIKKKHYRVNI
jgi:hypothetical protein